jgi:hypothetical protein
MNLLCLILFASIALCTGSNQKITANNTFVDDKCTICLDKFNGTQILGYKCNTHPIHENCLHQHILHSKRPRCPSCRAPIKSEHVSTALNNINLNISPYDLDELILNYINEDKLHIASLLLQVRGTPKYNDQVTDISDILNLILENLVFLEQFDEIELTLLAKGLSHQTIFFAYNRMIESRQFNMAHLLLDYLRNNPDIIDPFYLQLGLDVILSKDATQQIHDIVSLPHFPIRALVLKWTHSYVMREFDKALIFQSILDTLPSDRVDPNLVRHAFDYLIKYGTVDDIFHLGYFTHFTEYLYWHKLIHLSHKFRLLRPTRKMVAMVDIASDRFPGFRQRICDIKSMRSLFAEPMCFMPF